MDYYHSKTAQGWKHCSCCGRLQGPREFIGRDGIKDPKCNKCRKDPSRRKEKKPRDYELLREYQMSGCPWETGDVEQELYGGIM
jgi:hypothetical protein